MLGMPQQDPRRDPERRQTARKCGGIAATITLELRARAMESKSVDLYHETSLDDEVDPANAIDVDLLLEAETLLDEFFDKVRLGA